MLRADDIFGVYTALVTPFTKDGELDEAAVVRMSADQINSGINGLVPVGGTGEYFSLSKSERNKVVELCVDTASKRVPVIPGVLSTGFQDALETCKDFTKCGADAVMVITPYYSKGTQQGIENYYRRLKDRVDLPIILYEIPSKTNVSIQAETVQSLAEDGTIIGMKYSSYDIAEYIRVAEFCSEKMALLSGEEPLFATHLAIGARAGIMVTSNLFPERWLDLYQTVVAGDFKSGLKKQAEMDPLMQVIFSETNPGPLKELLSLGGYDCGRPRLPLQEPTRATKVRIQKVLAEMLPNTANA